MGQFVLQVDPNAINPAVVGALISQYNFLPAAARYLNLTNRSGNGVIYVTDNINSPLFSEDNRTYMQSQGSALQGLAQINFLRLAYRPFLLMLMPQNLESILLCTRSVILNGQE